MDGIEALHRDPVAAQPVASRPARHWPALIAIALTLFAVLRVAATWPVFSTIYDEPAHLATGMEWLDRGVYRYEPQHPPLARVAIAVGPYLDGSRSVGLPDMWDEGDAILRGRDTNQRTLTLARAGILPFLLLGAFGVWLWTRRAFGDWTACLAVAFFTTLPVVLAHAGFATTDMAVTACFTLAMLALSDWLHAPDPKRAAVAGAALALAALAKFTALPFAIACAAAMLGWRWLLRRRGGEALRIGALLRSTPALMAAAFLVAWAGYRFSLQPIAALHDSVIPVLEARVPPPWRGIAIWLATRPVPLSELAFGLAEVLKHNGQGHTSFLFGTFRDNGWWSFFPVTILVKTPLPFLLIGAAGLGATLGASWRARDWRIAVPALCAIAILLSVLPSRINIGIRHILPIFPFLAIGAAYAAMCLMARWRGLGASAVTVLLAWQLAAGLRAHPDQLTYFNALAGPHPEAILLTSDVDWGQDALRLARALQDRQAPSLTAFLIGQCDGLLLRDVRRMGFPPTHRLEPGERPAGWVAVSETVLATPPAAWLRALTPVARIGHSIRLYRLPDDPAWRPSGPVCGGPSPQTQPLQGWVPSAG